MPMESTSVPTIGSARAAIRAGILLSPLENHDYNDTQKVALPRVKHGVDTVKSRVAHGEKWRRRRLTFARGPLSVSMRTRQ